MLKSLNNSNVQRVLKITPDNDLIPSSINNFSHLFSLSNLSGSKFNDWRSLVSSVNSIMVYDDEYKSELPKFIDPDIDIDTPEGSLWFNANVIADKVFYLQVGTNLNKINSSDSFQNQFNSYGFNETSGNLIDRCGLRDGLPKKDVTYQQTGQLGKSIKFGPANSSRFEIYDMPYLSALTNVSLVTVVKLPDDNNIFQWVYLQIIKTSGGLVVYFSEHNYTFYIDTLPTDAYCLIVTTFDGDETGSDRIKAYVNGVLDTNIIFGDYSDPGQTETNSTNFGEIGSFPTVNNNIEIDEFRIFNKTLSQDEVTLIYNQWFNNNNYWTVTIQPIITSVVKNGLIWSITGSGFLPDGTTQPTGTAAGTSFTVLSVTDTLLVIQLGNNIDTKNESILIINSDNESFHYNMLINFKIDDITNNILNISSYIDNGYDVKFTDSNDNDRIVSSIFLNTDGYISVVGINYNDSNAKSIKLNAGKPHIIDGIHKILSDGTDKGIGIHVKI